MKDKNFINAFKKINVSNNLERNILNMTVNKEVKKRKFKLAYLAIIAVLITGFSLSFVYAKEIKGLIKDWSLKIGLGDEEGTVVDSKSKFGNKIVPDDIKQNEVWEPTADDWVDMTFNEIEEMLGFNILNLDKYANNEVSYDTVADKDGHVRKISVTVNMHDDIEEYTIYSEEDNRTYGTFLHLYVDILTQYADESDFENLEECIEIIGGKKIEEPYHSKNLDIDITFYTQAEDYMPNDWAIFTYDNVLYRIGGNGVTREKLIEIIENLK